MRAGRLRHMITIQRPVKGKDGAGAPITTWENVASPRAGVELLPGREYEKHRKDQTEAPARFLIRYIPGLDASMRISFDGKYYTITQPPLDPDHRHRELVIMAMEKSYD